MDTRFYHNNYFLQINMALTDLIQERYFCYLYIEEFGSALIGFGITLLVLIFMIKTWNQYSEARKTGKINRTIQATYLIILCLCISYIPQIVLSETFFWLSYLNKRNLQNQTAQTISKYIFIMQFIQQILFETILLLISYNWSSNIVSIFRQILTPSQVNRYFRWQIIMYKIIRIFIFVRFLEISICVIFIITSDAETLDHLAKITFGIFTFQEIFTFLNFLIFINLLCKNEKLKQRVEKSGVNKMVMSYVYLAVLILFNIAWNIWYLIGILTNPNQPLKPFQCKIKSDVRWDVSDILEMLILIVLNLFAFLIVLKLYRVDKKGPISRIDFQNQPELIKSDQSQNE